jgi:hypothetical protein
MMGDGFKMFPGFHFSASLSVCYYSIARTKMQGKKTQLKG